MKAIFAVAGLFMLGTLGLGFPGAAEAESARDQSQGIEEVIVTARRREETAQAVPIPVSALSGDQLRERASPKLRTSNKSCRTWTIPTAG